MINRRCGRRDFVLAVAGLVATLSMGSTLPAAERLDQELSRGAFLAYLGQTFRVYGGPGLQLVIKMELIEVEDKRIGPQTEQFAILLRAPQDAWMPKGVYVLENPEAGKFKLLLEPDGQDEQGAYYRADFNLLR